MVRRRAPKQAVWRRHRVWPWALGAVAVALVAGWQLSRLVRGRAAPFALSVEIATPRPPDSEAVDAKEDGTGLDLDGGARGRHPPGSLPTVAVLNSQGAAVPGCTVELRVPGQREDAVSIGAADCQLVPLGAVPPGDYLLSGRAPGFQRSERPVHLGPGPSTWRLALVNGLALSGHVVDAAGRPVPGVSVAVSPIHEVARSDGAGAFRLSVPSPGVYSLEAHHSDWGGAVQTVEVPSADVLLRLQPRSVLELKVLSGGQPVEGAKVDLFNARDSGGGGQYEADRATGADGAVRLQGFPAGTYTLGVLRPGALRPSQLEVVLREGAATPLTVTLPVLPAGTIEGDVVDAAGRPLQGASVRVQPPDVAPVQSDAAGHFRLLGVPAGVDYHVAAVVERAESGARQARAGDTGLRLSVSPAKRYRGRVLDASHTPVPKFRVGDMEVDAEDGRFALALPTHEGTLTFTVEAPPLASATLVRRAEAEEVGDIVLGPAPLMHGVVRAADGAPAAGALVVCEGCRGEGDGERRLTALTDGKGRFTLSIAVAHGERFRLVAMKDGQLGWAEAGRVGEGALLTLAAPAPVRGRVLGPGGKAAPGVAVVFSEALLEPLQLVTGVDGTFFGPVPPGLYEVTVVPDASVPPRTFTVQVPADHPLELATGAIAH